MAFADLGITRVHGYSVTVYLKAANKAGEEIKTDFVMIYTNDNTDRKIRKRNYLLSVIALPAAVIVIIVATIYYLYNHHYINQTDRSYGYFLSVSLATILFTFSKRKWLKMPDGSYFRVQNEETRQVNSFNEPVQFERAYYNSRSKKAIGILAGVVLVVFGVFMYTQQASYIISAMTIIAGLFAVADGIKGFFDKVPKLKLSSEGLWTKKLGFVKWKDVRKRK